METSVELRPGALPAAAARAVGPAAGAEPGAPPVVWAVASGKGGVGKSVLCSSLAIALCQTGPRVVAVDLDLGGANLHTLFGLERAPRTLADFLRGDVGSLDEAAAPTSVPGVSLLSGARALLDMANPKYAQKQKLLRHLRRLDAGHVVLDLGAGSGFNTLDFFVAADRRVLVVTPETTALENAQHFLKAAFFRSLRDTAREPRVRAALVAVLEDARRNGRSPRELVEAAARRDARAGSLLRERVRSFGVDLVVNRADLGGRDVGESLRARCRARLGATLRLGAALGSDDCVPAAVARGVPVLQLFPGCAFAEGVRAWVGRLDEPAPRATPRPAWSRARAGAPPDEDGPPAALPLPDFEGGSPGRHLRICRELRGLSLRDLHERTRIRHLAEIEAERFDALPPEPYLRGFVRQYAEALGAADAAGLADRFVERAREARVRRHRARRA